MAGLGSLSYRSGLSSFYVQQFSSQFAALNAELDRLNADNTKLTAEVSRLHTAASVRASPTKIPARLQDTFVPTQLFTSPARPAAMRHFSPLSEPRDCRPDRLWTRPVNPYSLDPDTPLRGFCVQDASLDRDRYRRNNPYAPDPDTPPRGYGGGCPRQSYLSEYLEGQGGRTTT